jgi:uncharacterized protein YdcH (DUF465 family)
MSDPDEMLKQELLDSNDEYRQLFAEHQVFERRLEELHLKNLLSQEDEVEAKTIKRHKLYLKDQMELILRSQREAQVTV